MKKNLLAHSILFVVAFMLGGVLTAQTTFEDVGELDLLDIHPIVEQSEVTGYYMIYKNRKSPGRLNSYVFRILDADLKEVVMKPIIEENDFYYAESTTDGKIIGLKFYKGVQQYTPQPSGEMSSKSFKYYFDRSGNELGKVIDDIGKLESHDSNTSSRERGSGGEKMEGIANKGIVHYRTVQEGAGGFIGRVYSSVMMDFFPSDKELVPWKYSIPITSKYHHRAAMLYSNGEIIFSLITRQWLLMGESQAEYLLMANDLVTGEKLFEISLQDDENVFIPMIATHQTGNKTEIQMLGTYYSKRDKISSEKYKGIFSCKVDIKGEMSDMKTIKWDKIGNSISGGVQALNMKMHTLVKQPNGNLYLLAELFNGNLSSTSSIRTAIGLGSTIEVGNLLALEFNPQMDFVQGKSFEKHAIPFYNRFFVANPNYQADVVDAMGKMGFSFLQKDEKSDDFIIGYQDNLEKSSNFIERTFIAVKQSNGAFTERKRIQLNNQKVDSRAYAAKAGYVMIAEYSERKKFVTLRLEKL